VLGRYRRQNLHAMHLRQKVVPRLEDLALRAAAARGARRPHLPLSATSETLRTASGRTAYGKILSRLRGEPCSATTTGAARRGPPIHATKQRISAVMDWAGGRLAASLTPFGGGSSGLRRYCRAREFGRGFAIRRPSHLTSAISVRLSRVDQISRAALIEAGAYGPIVGEPALSRMASRCGNFPTEFRIFNPWAAGSRRDRAAIFASLYTHIDDFRRKALRASVNPARHIGKHVDCRDSGAGPEPRSHVHRLGRERSG